jgi:hypothetical protein
VDVRGRGADAEPGRAGPAALTRPLSDPAAALDALIPRIGALHLRQRLGMERDHEARLAGPGLHMWQVDRWYSMHSAVRTGLRLSGLLGYARRLARRVTVRRNPVVLPHLPPAFEGFTLLQLSDLHIDAAPDFTAVLIEAVRSLDYDVCVLTGDYRHRTFGPHQPTLDGMAALRPHLQGTPFAVLGNHDTIHLVPAMEALGYRFLLNEWTAVQRGDAAICLAGIDDAHTYRLEDFGRVTDGLPAGAVRILLSHTPETYRHAAHAGFDLMLCGHTHGGQLCLPGGHPLKTEAHCPRRVSRGAWRHHGMAGYTSVGSGTSLVDVRLNCPPEVTLHILTTRTPLPPQAGEVYNAP